MHNDIMIEIKKTANNALRLNISKTIDGKLTTVEHEYPLTPAGILDFQHIQDKISDSSIVMKNSGGQQLTIMLPGVNGVINLDKSGNATFENINTQAKLSLKTDFDIWIDTPLIAKSLTLHAKNLINTSEITAEERLDFNASDSLMNISSIHSDGVAVISGYDFINMGIVSSANLIEATAEIIVNSGSLLAKKINLDTFKDSKFRKDEEVVTFNNGGTILAENDLSLTIAGIFFNDKKAQLLSRKNVTLKGVSFYNLGYVFVHNKLKLKALKKIFNNKSGSIAGGSVRCITQQEFTNQGKIYSSGIANLTAQEFYNIGRIDCGALGLLVHNSFLNDALIKTKTMELDAKEYIINTAKILSEQKVNMRGLYKLHNSGEITGHGVTVTTNNSMANDLQGKILGDLISLQSIKAMVSNFNLIEADKDLKIKAKSTYVAEGGTLSSKAKLSIESAQVDIKGRVAANRLLTINADVFNNYLSGKISSLGELLLIAKKELNNQNLIKAKGPLTIDTGTLNNDRKGLIESDTTFRLKADFFNNQGEIKALRLFLEVASRFCNRAHAVLSAKICLELLSGETFNKGSIHSQGTALLHAARHLSNELNASITANDWIKLASNSSINNAAQVITKGDLFIDALNRFSNVGQGLLKGKNIDITSELVSNAALIKADKNLTVHAKCIFENLLVGLIFAGEKAELFSEDILVNGAKIQSKGSLLLKADGLLKNLKEGVCISAADLNLLTSHILQNMGTLFARKDLLVKSGHWINNQLAARMIAEAKLHLESGYRIDNDGLVKSSNEMSLKSESFVLNFSQGNISAVNLIDAFTKLALENEGCIKAAKIKLKSNLSLHQAKTGVTDASAHIDIESRHHKNAGLYKCEGDIKMRSDFTENTGGIQGRNIDIISQVLLNRGSIESVKDLSLNIEQSFIHYREGRLSSNEILSIFTHNLQLFGQLIAKGELRATVDSHFDYNFETLWVTGLLKLMLKSGFTFSKPIQTQGGLEIESPSGIAINAKLEAQGDASVHTPHLHVAQGGLFAGKALNTNTQTLTLKPGTFLASNGKMKHKSGSIHNNEGFLYTLDDLLLEALYRIENAGDITVGGSAKVIAPIFNHKILTREYIQQTANWEYQSDKTIVVASSKAPSMTVSKDCDFISTPVDILGAHLHVGGKLSKNGNHFHARSFESFASWVDRYDIKGKRKRPGGGYHHKYDFIPGRQTLAIYGSQVSAGQGIAMQGLNTFFNSGCMRTHTFAAGFHHFYNAYEHSTPIWDAPFQEWSELQNFFHEDILFAKNDNPSVYLYGPRISFSFTPNLAPRVVLGNQDITAPQLFHPIIEKDLIQRVLQKNLRSGYVESGVGSPEAILCQARFDAYEFARQERKVSLEADLMNADRLMLFYQPKVINSHTAVVPSLFIPNKLYKKIKTGTANQAVIRAVNLVFEGDIGSSIINEGGIKVDLSAIIKVDHLRVQQRTYTEHQPMRVNKKSSTFVAQINPIPGTGVIEAGHIQGKFNTLTQIGGHIHSSLHGTYLEIRDHALLEALRTTKAIQAEISRGGRNYQIEPVFIPARMTSDANQTIIVTHGDFMGKGIESIARGKNKLDTPNGNISVSLIKESFEEASSVKRSRMGTKKIKSGGSNVSSLSSVIEGAELEISGQHIQLINAILISSDGDTTLKAKRLIEILSDTIETTRYGSSSKFKGFGRQKQSIQQSTTQVLPSRMLVNGNLRIEAVDAYLKAVQGMITQNMTVEAINVLIEGATAKQTTTTQSRRLSLSFFGSNALEKLMEGKHARAALEALLRNDSFIDALHNLQSTKDKGEKITQSVQTFIEGWNLLSSVAQACDNPNGSVFGTITDRCGITTPVKDARGNITGHKFNPKFTFTFATTKTRESFERNVPSILVIGGHFHIVADTIKLLGGTQIKADNITLVVRKLLLIKAAKKVDSHQQSQSSTSASCHLDGRLAGASTHSSHYKSEKTQYDNTCLKAQKLISILSENTVIKGGELEARDVLIKSASLILESLQDTSHSKGQSQGVSIGDSTGGVNLAKEKSKSNWVNHQSFIKATKKLELFIDYITMKGSLLTSDEEIRIKGLSSDNPLKWEHEDIANSSTNSSNKVNAHYNGENSSTPLTVMYNGKKGNKEGITRATISAPIISGNAPIALNRDIKAMQKMLVDTNKSTGIPIVTVNGARVQSDAKSMKNTLDKFTQELRAMFNRSPIPGLSSNPNGSQQKAAKENAEKSKNEKTLRTDQKRKVKKAIVAGLVVKERQNEKNFYTPTRLINKTADEAAKRFVHGDTHEVPGNARSNECANECANELLSNAALQNVMGRLPLKALRFINSPAGTLNGQLKDNRISQRQSEQLDPKLSPTEEFNRLMMLTEMTEDIFYTYDRSQFHAEFISNCLIGAGRSYIKTVQGIKQLGLQFGEKVGVTDQSNVLKYTYDINAEADFYYGTPVGRSTTARVAEFATDVGLAWLIPVGASFDGLKFVISSIASGSIMGCLQSTRDASLSSRLPNMLEGAVYGLLGAAKPIIYEGRILHYAYTLEKRGDIYHIFSKVKGQPKHGHLSDTFLNRRLIAKTVLDQKNYLGKTKNGVKCFAEIQSDGSQVWAEFQPNGTLRSGGLNVEAVMWDSEYGLRKNSLNKK